MPVNPIDSDFPLRRPPRGPGPGGTIGYFPYGGTPPAPSLLGGFPSIVLPPTGQTNKLELLNAALGRPVPLAYGRHIVGGTYIFEREEADGSVVLLIALGEGEWDAVEYLWVNGLLWNLTDTATFHFHPGTEGERAAETSPGTRNQKICQFFPVDFNPRLTFSRTAYIALKLLRDPMAPGPGFDVRGIYKTCRVRDFTASAFSGYGYSFNPARVAMDILLRRYLFTGGKINETVPSSVTARIDFSAWNDWKAFCDADLTINGETVNRFETHLAFVDPTDVLRALEWVSLQGRAVILEKNGKFAPFIDQARSAELTLTRDDIQAASLALRRRALRDAKNRFVIHYRSLDSGAAVSDPEQDFQVQIKEVADEDHQEQVGRINTEELDLGNSRGERAERIGKYLLGRSLSLPDLWSGLLLPNKAGVVDLLPGDRITAPSRLDFTATDDFEILEISEGPDGTREAVLGTYDESIFGDTADPQQTIKQTPKPGGGFSRRPPQMKNVLQNGGFFRVGVVSQEGTNRPKFFQGYSNSGAGPPAWTTDLEHDLTDRRVKVKTKTSAVDKIGVRTLWRNLGKMFRPGQRVTVAVCLRHSGASGTYDKDVKVKVDSAAQDYNGSAFLGKARAGTITNSFTDNVLFVTFTLLTGVQVPDKLNVFIWSEATNASKSNEDLEILWVTLCSGQAWRPYDPADEIDDLLVLWNAGDSLYDLPAHLVGGGTPTSDSGGAGGGTGSSGDDLKQGRTRNILNVF